jgi:type IV secretory pathway VirB6-like protein
MSYYLKTLSTNKIEDVIKERIDQYLGREFTYTVKDLNTPNVNTEGNKITFSVEIRDENTE